MLMLRLPSVVNLIGSWVTYFVISGNVCHEYVYVVSTTNRWIIFPGELERGGAHNEQVDLPHARDVRAN